MLTRIKHLHTVTKYNDAATFYCHDPCKPQIIQMSK